MIIVRVRLLRTLNVEVSGSLKLVVKLDLDSARVLTALKLIPSTLIPDHDDPDIVEQRVGVVLELDPFLDLFFVIEMVRLNAAHLNAPILSREVLRARWHSGCWCGLRQTFGLNLNGVAHSI